MSKLSNTLTMLELLKTGRKYSIKELSNILEVSERMIRIYKEDLDKAGIYLDTIMGPYGGYVLNQTVRIPVRKFNDLDIKLLDNLIKKEKDNDLKEQIKMLKDKINGIHIGSDNTLFDDNIKNIYNILTRAIKEKRKVRIKYISNTTGVKVRIINPVEMYLFQDGWYCAAYCEYQKSFRHFTIEKMIEYELLDEKYE